MDCAALLKRSRVKNDLNSMASVNPTLACAPGPEGNDRSLRRLFNAHRNKVYSLCLRMTSNTAEAEDLTQDAFLQVFRKLSSFRGDSALSTWALSVAVNTVLMHFRKKGLRRYRSRAASTTRASQTRTRQAG